MTLTTDQRRLLVAYYKETKKPKVKATVQVAELMSLLDQDRFRLSGVVSLEELRAENQRKLVELDERLSFANEGLVEMQLIELQNINQEMIEIAVTFQGCKTAKEKTSWKTWAISKWPWVVSTLGTIVLLAVTAIVQGKFNPRAKPAEPEADAKAAAPIADAAIPVATATGTK